VIADFRQSDRVVAHPQVVFWPRDTTRVPRSCEFASLDSDVRRFGDPSARMASQSLHDRLGGDAWNYLSRPENSDTPLSGIPFRAVWLHSCCSRQAIVAISDREPPSNSAREAITPKEELGEDQWSRSLPNTWDECQHSMQPRRRRTRWSDGVD
jgi:hypothetical protein